MIDKLLGNLHPAINKDPQSVAVLQVNGTGTLIIKNDILQLIGSSGSAQYNLRTYTLGSLATALDSVVGIDASCQAVPALSASCLLSGTYTLPTALPIFTSFLWQIFKPVALSLLDALDASGRALQETILNTSEGYWLDSFGELFGVTRETNEPDTLYAIRVLDMSVNPRVNNIAIQKALHDLQYDATVTDGPGTSFVVNVTLPSNPPQGFIYSTAQMRDLVDLLRTSGVSYTIKSQGTLNDSLGMSDSISVSNPSSVYGQGRKWGMGIWGV